MSFDGCQCLAPSWPSEDISPRPPGRSSAVHACPRPTPQPQHFTPGMAAPARDEATRRASRASRRRKEQAEGEGGGRRETTYARAARRGTGPRNGRADSWTGGLLGVRPATSPPASRVSRITPLVSGPRVPRRKDQWQYPRDWSRPDFFTPYFWMPPGYEGARTVCCS